MQGKRSCRQDLTVCAAKARALSRKVLIKRDLHDVSTAGGFDRERCEWVFHMDL